MALHASKAMPRSADFLSAIHSRKSALPRAGTAAAALLPALSVFHALARQEYASHLRRRILELQSERQLLETRLSRWKNPRVQAARRVEDATGPARTAAGDGAGRPVD